MVTNPIRRRSVPLPRGLPADPTAPLPRCDALRHTLERADGRAAGALARPVETAGEEAHGEHAGDVMIARDGAAGVHAATAVHPLAAGRRVDAHD